MVRSIYLNHSIPFQKTKCFNSTYVLGKTPSCSIKQLSMHSTTKKIFSPKKKKKKINRWWEENNSLCNMTCNTKITCIRLSNFYIKIVLYSFKNLPWKYEKTGVPYLTSLHYSHDTNSYAKINRHYEENFDAFKQIYNWSKQPQYNYMHYIDLVKKLK